MQDILLIDGNALGFAAQSTHKLNAPSGEPTQAIFGFMRSLRTLLEEYRRSKPVVFWDGASWRKDECAEYKANREEKPEQVAERNEYKSQRPAIGRILTTLGVRQMFAPNLEADDLIAMTVWKLAGRIPATIITGDRDLLQLVGPNVAWHNPINYKHGSPRFRYMTEHAFAEEVGYETTDAFVQGKALMGDTSDNLPGVGGIGEKGAPLLLGHWGTVERAIKDLRANGRDAVPPALARYKKKLVDFATSDDAVARFHLNMKMMHLTPANIPAPTRLVKLDGAMNREHFEDQCARYGFISILRDVDGWIMPFEHAGPSYGNKAAA